MNFNRIQKYRSERTIAQLNSVRNNRHVTAAEAATEVGDSRPLDLVLAGKNGNKIQQSTNQSQQSYIQPRGLTLREYLHINASSARKPSSLERPKKSSVQSRGDGSRDSKKNIQRGDSPKRKEKKEASNAEIFQIIKDDIKKDLGGLQSMAQQLSATFVNIADYQRLDNSKMMQIYNFRKMIRENVIKQMKKLNELLVKIKGSEKQEKSMPVIFEKEEEERYDTTIQMEPSVQLKQQLSNKRLFNRTRSLKN